MEGLANSKELRFVLTLYKNEDGTFEIYVNSLGADNRDTTIYWAQITNRYAVINESMYPLLFDYDYDFGTPRPSETGTYGQREGQVPRIITCNDGFHLTFSKSGICPQTSRQETTVRD